jgi:hypothetical protein
MGGSVERRIFLVLAVAIVIDCTYGHADKVKPIDNLKVDTT